MFKLTVETEWLYNFGSREESEVAGLFVFFTVAFSYF